MRRGEVCGSQWLQGVWGWWEQWGCLQLSRFQSPGAHPVWKGKRHLWSRIGLITNWPFFYIYLILNLTVGDAGAELQDRGTAYPSALPHCSSDIPTPLHVAWWEGVGDVLWWVKDDSGDRSRDPHVHDVWRLLASCVVKSWGSVFWEALVLLDADSTLGTVGVPTWESLPLLRKPNQGSYPEESSRQWAS